jgi:hypothetical protein
MFQTNTKKSDIPQGVSGALFDFKKIQKKIIELLLIYDFMKLQILTGPFFSVPNNKMGDITRDRYIRNDVQCTDDSVVSNGIGRKRCFAILRFVVCKSSGQQKN